MFEFRLDRERRVHRRCQVTSWEGAATSDGDTDAEEPGSGEGLKVPASVRTLTAGRIM